MPSHQSLVAWLRSEIPFFKAGNIYNHIQKWEAITNDKFILNIIENGVSVEFRETTICQYIACIKFSDLESNNWHGNCQNPDERGDNTNF